MLKTPPLSLSEKKILREGQLVHRSPIYYGWVVMLVATLGAIMTTPGQTFGVTIFINHFIDDLGISRTAVSSLYTIGTLLASLLLTYVGLLIDRFGPRIVMAVATVLLGLTCIYMSSVQGLITLGIGFFLLRLLGQGSLSLVSTNAINQWWMHRRGTVLGVSGAVSGLFGLGVGPNLLNWLVGRYGWQMSYIFMGLVLIFIGAPIVYFFLRSRPENYGLLPDGVKTSTAARSERSATGAATSALPVTEENWTLAEAMRTRIYWVFTLGMSSIAMLSTGLTFHMISIFEDNGVGAELAAAAFVPVAMTMAVVNVISGVLVNRIRLRDLAAGSLVLQAIALWMVPYLGFAGLAMVFGIVLGTVFGLMRTVSTVAWARYFGRLHLGTIAGLYSTITAASSALGPLPMGLARDLLGSYNSTLNLLAFLPLVLGITCLFVDVPQKETNS